MRLRSILALRPDYSNLELALTSDADAILVTVANGGQEPSSARVAAAGAIATVAASGKRALALVNHPRTQLLRGDLEALVSAQLSAVLVTHTTEPQDVRDAAVLLREFELARDVEIGAIAIFPSIATARGLMRAGEIVGASPRVKGLVLDSIAFASDIGARAEERGHRFSYARGAVVTAARSVDALPIVSAEGFEMRELGHYGFAGAIVPDLRAVPIANTAFTPTDFERRRANAHIAIYEAARGNGDWVARYEDEVIDASAARRARQLLDQV